MTTRSRGGLVHPLPENARVVKDKDVGAQRHVSSTAMYRTALSELSNKFNMTKISEKKEPKMLTNVFSRPSNIPKPVTETAAKPIELHNKNEINGAVSETCPPAHHDIDKEDFGNIYLLGAYVNDVYKHLKHLEDLYPIRPDFLDRQAKITPAMRSIVVDWMVDVQVQYRLLLETLHLSVSILDRFLQGDYCVPKDKLQLVGITSIFIAAKYEESYPPDISDFIYVCASAYTKAEFLEMEIKILETLGFNLGRPIPILFLRRYSKAAKSLQLHHSFAKYILELALLNCKVVHFKPSMIAAAALYIAYCIVNEEVIPGDIFWTPTLKYYSGLSFDQIEEIISKLASCVASIHTSNLMAVRKKYSSSKFCKVSLLPVVGPDSKVIKQLMKLKQK